MGEGVASGVGVGVRVGVGVGVGAVGVGVGIGPANDAKRLKKFCFAIVLIAQFVGGD